MNNTNTQNVMKHFASSLRKRGAMSTASLKTDITPTLLKYLSRKELVEILLKKWDDLIPKNLNLLEMENIELLNLIEDEMFILAHLSTQWCLSLKKDEVKPKTSSVSNAKPPAHSSQTDVKSNSTNSKKKGAGRGN